MHTRTTDIYLIPSAGGEEHKVTFDSNSDANPRFSPDGRKLFFVRNEGEGWRRRWRRPGLGADLLRRARTLKIATRTTRRHGLNSPKPPIRRAARAAPARQQRNQPPREIKIDWAGLKRRTRQVTRMPSSVFNYAVTPDSRTIVFVTSEPAGLRNTPVDLLDSGRRTQADPRHCRAGRRRR